MRSDIGILRSSLHCKKVHTYITLIVSKLDYNNALHSERSQASIPKLQVVQNATAKLLTKTKKFDHITPVLAELHWRPVELEFRVNFRIVLFVCL